MEECDDEGTVAAGGRVVARAGDVWQRGGAGESARAASVGDGARPRGGVRAVYGVVCDLLAGDGGIPAVGIGRVQGAGVVLVDAVHLLSVVVRVQHAARVAAVVFLDAAAVDGGDDDHGDGVDVIRADH